MVHRWCTALDYVLKVHKIAYISVVGILGGV